LGPGTFNGAQVITHRARILPAEGVPRRARRTIRGVTQLCLQPAGDLLQFGHGREWQLSVRYERVGNVFVPRADAGMNVGEGYPAALPDVHRIRPVRTLDRQRGGADGAEQVDRFVDAEIGQGERVPTGDDD